MNNTSSVVTFVNHRVRDILFRKGIKTRTVFPSSLPNSLNVFGVLVILHLNLNWSTKTEVSGPLKVYHREGLVLDNSERWMRLQKESKHGNF